MSKEFKALKMYKQRMVLSYVIGILGIIILFILVYYGRIKIWHFFVAGILLSIICAIFHKDSKSKFEFIFSNKESFNELISNTLNHFCGFKVSREDENIKEFVVIKNEIEGEYIDIKTGLIPISNFENEILVKKGDEVLELNFSKIPYLNNATIKIFAPANGIVSYKRGNVLNNNRLNNGEVICSINVAQKKIDEYNKELYIKEEKFRKAEEEQIKYEIREKILEKEKRKKLEKEIKEEMINEGLVSDSSDNHKREPIPQDIQDRVWRRDGGKCVKCGNQEKLEFDHIIPFSKGGANTYRNLQLLCENCNRQKSNKIG